MSERDPDSSSGSPGGGGRDVHIPPTKRRQLLSLVSSVADELTVWLVVLAFLPAILKERWRRRRVRESEGRNRAIDNLLLRLEHRVRQISSSGDDAKGRPGPIPAQGLQFRDSVKQPVLSPTPSTAPVTPTGAPPLG